MRVLHPSASAQKLLTLQVRLKLIKYRPHRARSRAARVSGRKNTTVLVGISSCVTGTGRRLKSPPTEPGNSAPTPGNRVAAPPLALGMNGHLARGTFVQSALYGAARLPLWGEHTRCVHGVRLNWIRVRVEESNEGAAGRSLARRAPSYKAFRVQRLRSRRASPAPARQPKQAATA
jgi:hypothetical protein